MPKAWGALWVCDCCWFCHHNGECCGDRLHEHEPLNRIDYRQFSITAGLLLEEHNDYCTPADREEGCDCGEINHSHSSCEGCGTPYHGKRYAVTLWDELVSV